MKARWGLRGGGLAVENSGAVEKRGGYCGRGVALRAWRLRRAGTAGVVIKIFSALTVP